VRKETNYSFASFPSSFIETTSSKLLPKHFCLSGMGIGNTWIGNVIASTEQNGWQIGGKMKTDGWRADDLRLIHSVVAGAVLLRCPFDVVLILCAPHPPRHRRRGSTKKA
jgi:hypothetical protein